MKDKANRIMIAIVGSIFLLSFFLPLILKNDSNEQPLKITITQNDPPIASTKPVESKKSVSVETSSADKSNNIAFVTTAAASPAVTELSSPLYIDINTASLDELQQLKGIGPVIAQEILNYRTENGGFNNIDELLLVSGIGEVIFSGIKDSVYVVDPVWPEPDDEEYSEDLLDDIAVIIDEETQSPSNAEDIPLVEAEEIFPINVNTADKETLMLIQGIDEDIADEIIRVREGIGGFENIYELLLVKGLSRSHISDIEALLCF